ncbi:MAG TPA: FMN-binding negative transcriptional regulator [Rhizobiaceae bacterium]|nr:FMN-binding negative transcriptional regulator [Rhizobiaceae bacterium]
MYVPTHFANIDENSAADWLHSYPFGTLISGHDGALHATSLPFILDDSSTDVAVISHMAARNAHAAALKNGQDVLVVVNSPSSYISPRWYGSPINVPTWNYIGLQLRGPISMITDRAGMYEVLERTVDTFEARAERPWKLSDAPTDLVERLLGGIVAFRIGPCRVECMEKLSQNKPADLETILNGLRAEGDEMAEAVAHLMQKRHSAS